MLTKKLCHLLSLAVAISTLGCQEQSTNSAGNEPAADVQPEQNEQPPVNVMTANEVESGNSETEESHAAEHKTGRRGMMGGGRHGGGPGGGPGMMGGMREDMSTLHAMFAGSDKITRTIKNLPNGAETLTESKDEEIAGLIQEHVPAMEGRVEKNNPLPPMTFHPIFVELIKHAEDYTFTYDETEHGVKVKYTSEDPYVVMLIQEHAKLVSRFVKNGMEEIHKPYTLPKLEREKE